MREDDNHKTTPWEAYPEIWKDKASFFVYLRGSLRRAWNKSPVKHSYAKKNRVKIPNPNPRGNRKEVWGAKCECCGHYYPEKNMQVDHINPSGKLNETEDIQGFVERLLYVTDEDIRLVCKECHQIITNMQKYGLTYEQELIERQVRSYKSAKLDKIKDKLIELDIEPEKTKAKCIDQYREWLNNEQRANAKSTQQDPKSQDIK